MATIHIAGLGPGSPGLLTGETSDLVRGALPVLLRTRRHPTVAALDPAGRLRSCDDLYQGAPNFDAVYEQTVDRVLAMASAGDVVYAVPGHPLVQERSVTLLIERAEAVGHTIVVHSSVSFVDAAATELRIDLGQVQVCDALALRIDCQRAALIGQVFDRDGASSLKLALLEVYPASHEVTVLRALGTAEATRWTGALSELDRRAAGYLDCIYVPPLGAIDDVRRFDGLAAVIARLHAPDGCPWDREQTHASLRPHLLEEAYETLAAIDDGDPAKIAEELGDVLLQVLMHAAIGEREETFSFADVAEQITTKLTRRHPHVFGDGETKTASEVHRDWEALKQAEKPRESILEGVPATLPALAAAQAMQGRARRVGFDWPDMDGPLEKLTEEVGELARARNGSEREDEFGDILFVVAGIAQRLGIDSEQALRRANLKFRGRFGELERLVRERSLDTQAMDLHAILALWDEAKSRTSPAEPE